MVTASGLAKSFGGRTLFTDVSLQLTPGRRVALIGGNGVGKTTMIELLLGLQEPDKGSVHRPKDSRIGYLPQDLEEVGQGTVLQVVLEGASHVTKISDRLRELEADLGNEKSLAEYGELQSRFEQIGGYAIESEAHRVMAGLGFPTEWSGRPVRELSGGWRMRVALAQLLLSEPDVLILDEPTNHLDVDSVAWLENHLAGWNKALLFVSHDRDFIDTVANRVVEVAGGVATEYVGGFAEFIVEREDRIRQAQASVDNQNRKVAHLEKFVSRFRYKATKARQVQSRIKTLEKLEEIPVPDHKELVATFGFPEPQRSSREVAQFRDVTAGYDGEAILSGVTMIVERGKKVGLVGPNGAGKTTLVKALSGQLEPMSGEIELGSNVDMSFFSQHQAEVLDHERTVLEEFKITVGDQGRRNLRTILASFGFRGDAVDRKVGDLSGGEQTRLALAEALTNPVNLMILDEPTNHLDLPSCDVLEDALSAYPGTVLLITHDRYLIRNVCDAIVEVRDGTAIWHDGVPDSVLTPGDPNRKPLDPAPRAATSPGKKLPKPNKKGGGPAKGQKRQAQAETKRAEAEQRNTRHVNTKELRKELRKTERSWEKAEEKVASLTEQLSLPESYEDPEKMKLLVAEHNEAKDKAAELMTAWESLSEQLDRTG